VAVKNLVDITKGLNMNVRAYVILVFIIILSLGFSKPAEEKNVTFIVTGNVRAEFNLCG
jgi:hypothetical protein